MSDAIQTMLRANRLVTVKSTGSHIAWEALDSTRSASCTRGRFGLQLIRRKTNECSQTKGIVPYRLVHSSAHLPQSLQLPACYFISANSPPASGTCEEHKSTRAFPFVLCFFFFFWDAEKNERLSLLTLSDEQFPDMAGNGYVSPFILYVTHWNDRRDGGEWWIRQCSKSLRAEAEL